MIVDTSVAIVGAGPYGLSTAAHLARRGVEVTTLGAPMTTWRRHMPAGMLLKSDGFATSLSAPLPGWTLGEHCRRAGVPYGEREPRVLLERFIDYGLAFQRELVPDLDTRTVARLAPAAGGFALTLDDGAVLAAERVVLAVGITHFGVVPGELRTLGDRVTHSSAHRDFERFAGRRVAVIGAGSSAVEVAAGLIDVGARVTMLVRRAEIPFWSAPQPGVEATPWDALRRPSSGLGPGYRSKLCEELPDVFRRLPVELRLKLVHNHLGPSSGWWLREKVLGGARILTSTRLGEARALDAGVALTTIDARGSAAMHSFDHVIAATGYPADVERLGFVDPVIRAAVRRVGTMPELTHHFESSVPGLYFVGAAAAGTFGPLLRFVVGSSFAAPRVAAELARRVPCRSRPAPGRRYLRAA